MRLLHAAASSSSPVPRRTSLLAALIVAALPMTAGAQEAWTPVADGFPRTTAESTGFQSTTSHQEMWDYLLALRAAGAQMRVGSYGETWEGRDIPYAVFSKPLVSEPWEAWGLNRPIVVIGANVHGGERTFREGVLILMRDFGTPGTAANALLDRVTVVVVPQVNPDGYEAGGGRGSRGNAWGIDLNRDYVKLEQPALANYVHNLLATWRPHVTLDLHNGGSQPYNLCYQCSSAYDPDQELTLVCDQRIFPAINAKLEAEGFRGFYYTGGNEEEWQTGGFQARIGRNYGGFTNNIGMLFEAPGGQTLEQGARAGYLGSLAVVEYAANHAQEIMGIVENARMETIALGAEPRGDIAVEMEYAPEDYPVSYTLIRRPPRDAAPGTPTDTIEVTGAKLIKKPVATKLRPRPWAYVIPRDAIDAVAMLQRHRITVEVLTEPTEVEVDAYTVADVTYESAYNHAAATRVHVGEVVTVTQTFPAGTYVVPTAQVLGRLAAHMLEPETDDNVIYWNTMDAWIPRPRPEVEEGAPTRAVDPEDMPPQGFRGRPQGPPLVPIYKVMSPTPMPTRMLEEGK